MTLKKARSYKQKHEQVMMLLRSDAIKKDS